MLTVTSQDEETYSPIISNSTRVKQSFGYSADQKWHNRTENIQSRFSRESTSNEIYFAFN